MRPVLLALLLAAALGACRAPAPGRVPGTASDAAELISSLSVEPTRDSVRFVLQVTNAGAAPAVVRFNSAQTHDFAVRDGGRELWRWSAGRGFAAALQSQTLAPGETSARSEVWVPAAGLSGRRLTAVGWLTSSSHPVERTAEFTLP